MQAHVREMEAALALAVAGRGAAEADLARAQKELAAALKGVSFSSSVMSWWLMCMQGFRLMCT